MCRYLWHGRVGEEAVEGVVEGDHLQGAVVLGCVLEGWQRGGYGIYNGFNYEWVKSDIYIPPRQYCG